MKLKNIFLISLIFLIVLTMGVVSASDQSVSDDLSISSDDLNNQESLIISEDSSIVSHVDEDDSLSVSNDDDSSIVSHVDEDDSNQKAVINADSSQEINMAEDSSKETLKSESNDNNQVKLNSTKHSVTINPVKKSVAKGKYFYTHLKDENGNELSNKRVYFTVNGKTYNTLTNKDGRAGLKIKLAIGKYPLKIRFNGNDKYNAVSKTLNLYVQSPTTIKIGNSRLLTNGYLRVYLKSSNISAISKKLLQITVNGKTFKKTTNSEGIVVFKPLADIGKLSIAVKFNGATYIAASSAKKSVVGIKGNVKNPFYNKIPLRNGAPDIDLMPAKFVLADGTMSYTLLKSQYLNVIKRDSHCLFLNNKLSNYTFFKSKKEPKLFHIISRKKWNVIERAINTKLVKKNKKGYWPSQITVSLKGKSYTYSEVRDVQDLLYSCGPTSASMCSQVLRNYVCEKYLVKLSGAKRGKGTSPTALKKALEKNNFKCKEFTKKSLNKAFNELKKGGCALIYHVWDHYVCILDISKNGKKVLVSNSRGGYNQNAEKIPTKWLTIKYMKSKFADDTPGLIVRLNYALSKKTKNQVNNFYSSMGANWTRQNTSQRIPQI